MKVDIWGVLGRASGMKKTNLKVRNMKVRRKEDIHIPHQSRECWLHGSSWESGGGRVLGE